MKNSNIKIAFFFLLINTYLNAEVLLFSKAYTLALENAHSLKSSVYQAESSKQRLAQEESRLYPQINLSGYYKKSEYTFHEPNRNPFRQGLFNYGITFKQAVYNAEVYSKIDIETSKNELYKISIELEKEQLAQTVFEVYLDVLKSHNKIKLYESYLKYSKSRLDELNKKYDMFMASKMDLLEMKVEYKSALIDLSTEKKILKVNKLKLKQLIGNIEYEIPSIASDVGLLEDIKKMRMSVLNKNDFSSNLQLLQAKLELKVSKAEIENAIHGHYPRLDLEGSMYAYETDNPDVQAPYKSTKSIMLVLNIPIYSGGYVSSRVSETKLKNKAINEKLLDTKKDIKVQYDEYSSLFNASIESVSMYKDAYESSLLYVDSIEQGYAHGLKSVIDLNDAKNKQYEVNYKYTENIYGMLGSYIGLLIVTNNFESIELLDGLLE